jgi:ATP-dependent DNA helicase RecQ
MVLSCVYRTGQRFGAGHVIDVLRGRDTPKVRQFQHERLSTLGIGADRSEPVWRSVVRQLMVQGYLLADPDRFGGLRLTSTSRRLLRGEVSFWLREAVRTPRPARQPRTKGVGEQLGTPELDEADQALWEALRSRRKALAEAQGVPPYVIFHDATLKEMLRARPTHAEALLDIPGVGAAKLERYGAAFLEVLQQAPLPRDAQGPAP